MILKKEVLDTIGKEINRCLNEMRNTIVVENSGFKDSNITKECSTDKNKNQKKETTNV